MRQAAGINCANPRVMQARGPCHQACRILLHGALQHNRLSCSLLPESLKVLWHPKLQLQVHMQNENYLSSAPQTAGDSQGPAMLQEYEERMARIAKLREEYAREDDILQTATAALLEKKVRCLRTHPCRTPLEVWATQRQCPRQFPTKPTTCIRPGLA